MNATKNSKLTLMSRATSTAGEKGAALSGMRFTIGGIVMATLLVAGCASNPSASSISIGEALAVPDDSKVVVTGKVVQQIDSDHYLLRDDTGSITAEIDEDLLGKVKVAPDARLRVGGTVDQDKKPAVLNAKTVQLVQ